MPSGSVTLFSLPGSHADQAYLVDLLLQNGIDSGIDCDIGCGLVVRPESVRAATAIILGDPRAKRILDPLRQPDSFNDMLSGKDSR